MDYKAFDAEKAKHLWKVGYGTKVVDDVLTLPDLHMLQCPARDGSELGVLFGAPCLTFRIALQELGIRFREWVSVGSIVLIFRSARVKEVKQWLSENFSERGPWYGLRCDRRSAAIAICDYRRRRDFLLADLSDEARAVAR